MHRRSVVFLISDFFDFDYEQALQMIRRRHDLIAVNLVDPRERNLPDVGFITLQDAESGQQVVVDTHQVSVRELFALKQSAEEERQGQMFRKLGIDEIRVNTSESYVEPLVHFFRTRMQHRR